VTGRGPVVRIIKLHTINSVRMKDKKTAAARRSPAYKDKKLSAEQRVKDLLSRMTLEEKAAQMVCVWQQKKDTLLEMGSV
jgi:hypothetical protein